eukprot:CAMPEP_0178993188 /NCGR_PEP_ID=MMETSP0795-20121207/6563_1 /TAXON_ID=88552 /ORGANISM="Amoebophrya sp., Strain Ameob2" /LENGTH=1215 /DNA_ID=CAMNT_0020685217 /DNA_START=247 /DNA_END=3894 /DNA_ORIENTATION=+
MNEDPLSLLKAAKPPPPPPKQNDNPFGDSLFDLDDVLGGPDPFFASVPTTTTTAASSRPPPPAASQPLFSSTNTAVPDAKTATHLFGVVESSRGGPQPPPPTAGNDAPLFPAAAISASTSGGATSSTAPTVAKPLFGGGDSLFGGPSNNMMEQKPLFDPVLRNGNPPSSASSTADILDSFSFLDPSPRGEIASNSSNPALSNSGGLHPEGGNGAMSAASSNPLFTTGPTTSSSNPLFSAPGPGSGNGAPPNPLQPPTTAGGFTSTNPLGSGAGAFPGGGASSSSAGAAQQQYNSSATSKPGGGGKKQRGMFGGLTSLASSVIKEGGKMLQAAMVEENSHPKNEFGGDMPINGGQGVGVQRVSDFLQVGAPGGGGGFPGGAANGFPGGNGDAAGILANGGTSTTNYADGGPPSSPLFSAVTGALSAAGTTVPQAENHFANSSATPYGFGPAPPGANQLPELAPFDDLFDLPPTYTFWTDRGKNGAASTSPLDGESLKKKVTHDGLRERSVNSLAVTGPGAAAATTTDAFGAAPSVEAGGTNASSPVAGEQTLFEIPRSKAVSNGSGAVAAAGLGEPIGSPLTEPVQLVKMVVPSVFPCAYPCRKLTVTNFRIHMQLSVPEDAVFSGGLSGSSLGDADDSSASGRSVSMASWLNSCGLLSIPWGAILSVKQYDQSGYKDLLKDFSSGFGFQIADGSGASGINATWHTFSKSQLATEFGGCYKISTKDRRVVYLEEVPAQFGQQLLECFRKFANAAYGPASLFAFAHWNGLGAVGVVESQQQMLTPQQVSTLEAGWALYEPAKEFARLGVPPSAPEGLPDVSTSAADQSLCPWRLSHVNKAYSLCESYPATLVVPKRIPDGMLSQVGSFRKKHRIPSLSWCAGADLDHACVFRSSQPCDGLWGNSSEADERLLREISAANGNKPLFILDLRTHKSALGNKAGGGGYEDYSFTQLEFAGIPNIHAVRDSYEKMEKAVGKIAYNQAGGWFADVGGSLWFENLSLILQAAANVAWKMRQKRAVLVHCSDGWDRTAQNTTLAMMAMDPFYRTIEGFCLLIQKEWVSFGHQFKTRLATSQKATGEYSPVFFQWLDCVYQFAVVQHPTKFEFNENLLLDLAVFAVSNRFGTFLADNERELTSLYAKKTRSVWSVLLGGADKKYVNERYEGRLPSVAVSFLPVGFSQPKLKLWERFWFRYHPHLLEGENQAERGRERLLAGAVTG